MPKTIKRYTHNPDGTAYGYEQNAHMRKDRAPHKSRTVKNLYFASAWNFPGGGFTGAIISGYFTVKNINMPVWLYVLIKTILVTISCTFIIHALRVCIL